MFIGQSRNAESEDEFRVVRERQVYPGDTDPSRGDLRNASPPECQSGSDRGASRTIATRGIDAIVTNDCETACASSDQRRVSQRGCRAVPSHVDTDDVAKRYTLCVAAGGDDANAIGFGVICATRGG